MAKKQKKQSVAETSEWDVKNSIDLYGINNWGAGHFEVDKKGNVVVNALDSAKKFSVRLIDIVNDMKERGFDLPALIRVVNILDSQIQKLYESFEQAIADSKYKGKYRGVYPIKVNQQQQVLEEVAKFGSKYHHGLEAGSKAELLAAIPYVGMRKGTLLVCNGYKDSEFIDLGLYARQIGVDCVFVIETPKELPVILERSEALGIDPVLGVRVKLSACAGGHWKDTGGDRSVFGLNATQIMEVVDQLKQAGKLHWLKMLHYHLGSQIPDIRDIRNGIIEACRVYTGLVEEGAPMGMLDLGGGLAVDYDGSNSNYSVVSCNYTVGEYCRTLVDSIMSVLDPKEIPHPIIVTESGRATVAYYSVLLFNILDISRIATVNVPKTIPADSPSQLLDIFDLSKTKLSPKNIQEIYHDALIYRDELRERFKQGHASLRHRALVEQIFWTILKQIQAVVKGMDYVPDDFEKLDSWLADIYYGNFSVFQSLPDSWAINQLFPIIPVHRLDEKPTCNAIISDITCDCDGKIDRFIDLRDVRFTLPLHELKENDEYVLGAFLVGAYQETLGDLHNLLGDTNVVSVKIIGENAFEYVREIEGDSVNDVLSYVEYDPKLLLQEFRNRVDQALKDEMINLKMRRKIVEAYENGLRGYTYFER